MSIRTALISGATGFIGRLLVEKLCKCNVSVSALVRPRRDIDKGRPWPISNFSTITADLLDAASLHNTCIGIDTVFHLAGYAHNNNYDDAQTRGLHQRITVGGTRALLAEATHAGVRRFVFISSVKAMGEGGDGLLDESYPPEPSSSYGYAKLMAERLVLKAGQEYGMYVSVLRLPIVYGHGHKGNLDKMIKAIDRGTFPPLPEVGNRRSMIHVDDVLQAILLVARNPQANGEIYIVTDGKAYSTREIYECICKALGRRVPHWSVPVIVLRAGAVLGDITGSILGRPAGLNTKALRKLLGSAWYSSGKISRELGYRPTRTLANALPEMVEEYRNSER